MNLFCKLLLALAGLFLVLVFLAVIAVVIGVVKPPRLLSVTHAWGEVTEASSEVISRAEIENDNSFDINTGRLSFQADIYLNDIPMGHGSLDEVHLPQGASTTRIETHIDNNRLPEWWASHISNQEFTTVRIESRAVLHLLGRNIDIGSPDLRRTVETDLLGKANTTDPEVLNQGPVGLLLKSRQVQWGEVTRGRTELTGALLVRNTSPFPATVARTEALARMNELLMVEAISTEPIALPPGKDVTIPFTLLMDNDKLLEWWPTHVNAGERTTFYLQLKATLEGTGADGGFFSVTAPLLVYQDQFVTNLLGG
ncbi:MAG: LEA type 2 family protein [Chloroflexi bacterium]|nr:LEA type 2 family protein [Chloroflexota bacterium]